MKTHNLYALAEDSERMAARAAAQVEYWRERGNVVLIEEWSKEAYMWAEWARRQRAAADAEKPAALAAG